MEPEIDVSGWPYTGERYESDYGFGSSCTCSKCMAGYHQDARSRYAPNYNTIKRPSMRTKTIQQREDEMAAEHERKYGAIYPYYQRNTVYPMVKGPFDLLYPKFGKGVHFDLFRGEDDVKQLPITQGPQLEINVQLILLFLVFVLVVALVIQSRSLARVPKATKNNS